MSKFNDIKMPESIDDLTKTAIKRGKKYKKNRKYKNIMTASAVVIVIGTSIIGIGIANPSIADAIPILKNIVEYFKNNNESIYKGDKGDLEKTSTDINLTTKDKGIELTIDSVSIDDNYITIFHTVKSEKNIKEYNEAYEEAHFANPIEDAYIDGKNITPSGLIEHEAIYISEKELKGLRKIDVSNVEIENGDKIEFRVEEIFGIEGDWRISAVVDKSKSISETYNYEIDKDFIINKEYDYHGEKINVKHDINIEKVIISPLASKIIISEKTTKGYDDWYPRIGNDFALFDENGKSLDVIDKGGTMSTIGVTTNSEEFIKASKDTKSLTLVPMSYDENIQNSMFEPQLIDKLPIIFEMSEYGKLVIEDIEITDKQIKYTYYKDGVVPHYPNLWFYDEKGNEIEFSSSIKESLDRHTGRYTTIRNLEGMENDIEKIRSIKKVSTFSNSDMKLLYDQQIKIDLTK